LNSYGSDEVLTDKEITVCLSVAGEFRWIKLSRKKHFPASVELRPSKKGQYDVTAERLF